MHIRLFTTLVVLWIAQFLVVTAPARADPLPESAYIDGIAGYAQRFSLSCESRSAVDWATYWGVSIREKKFLRNLPHSDNPDQGFVGNPDAIWGNVPPQPYGVHAEPVAALLRQYGLEAQAHRGLEWEDLKGEIVAGRPVIVWVIGQMRRGTAVRYTALDGHATIVARFEHTMILIGYDHSSVKVIDAYTGQKQTYPLRTFLASWDVLGRMAITGTGVSKEHSMYTPGPFVIQPLTPKSLTVQSYLPLITADSTTDHISYTPDSTAPADYYTVRMNDHIVALARRFNTSWQELVRLNHIAYPYMIRPGQRLRLPE